MKPSLKQKIIDLKKKLNKCTTNKYLFREISRCDCYPFFQATLNPQFNKNLLFDQPKNEAELMIEVEYLLQENQLNNAAIFMVQEKYNGKWIGIMKFTPFQESFSGSIYITPEYWNTRTGLELFQFIPSFLFNHTPFDSIYCKTAIENETVKKICKFLELNYLGNEILKKHNQEDKEVAVYKLSKETYNPDKFKKIQISIL